MAMRSRVRTHYLLLWMALLLIGGGLVIHAVSYAALYQAVLSATELTVEHQTDALPASLPIEPAVLFPQLHQIFLVHLSLMISLLVAVLTIFALILYRDQTRLSQLAARDPLTDSLNHQTFDVVFGLFLHKSIRDHSPMCAVLINIDHLSKINHLHSHLAGDLMLQDFVKLIKSMQRRSDVLARWSDCEFILLLPDCALEEAVRIANQLRLRIRNHDFGLAKNWIVTFSAGVAEYATGESEEEFTLRLEDALARAKQHGRNRVEMAPPAFSTILPVFVKK